jgi:NAD(P)-dependent dehydrogenase (short-subunit alcohol dehydrogenase family)
MSLNNELDGKSVVITGGTAGIGLATARELARRGANVILVGRDPGRGAAAVATIQRIAPSASVTYLAADLSSQRQVRALATALGGRIGRLDILINNAGAMFGERTLSADGIEMTFALNHLAYFLLSHLLLDLLERSSRARIVNVASQAHHGVRLDFDNLQGQRHYSAWRAYKCSKLANVMFTYEFARRLQGSGITVNALHPGFVATDIGVRQALLPGWLWKGLTLFALDPDEGARTSVQVAAAPELASVSGRYFVKTRPARSSAASLDCQAVERLWAVSETLTGVGKT